MSDSSENISCKISILGEPAVGKTTLRKNYIGKGMEGDFLMTLGADLSESIIKISDKITLDVQIWDIAGQDNFAPIIGEYLRGSQGAILVYDMTRGYTFDELTKWLERLHQANPQMDNNIPFIVVGNKADLDNFYNYDEDKVNEFIDYVNRHGLYTKTPVEHIQTSAKTGYAVQEAFKRLGKIIIRNWIESGEEIDGAAELFDDIDEPEPEPEVKETQTINYASSSSDDDEHLVKPSELLRRRQQMAEEQEKDTSSAPTGTYTGYSYSTPKSTEDVKPDLPVKSDTESNTGSDGSEHRQISTKEISFSEVANEGSEETHEAAEEVVEEPKETIHARFDDMNAFQFGEEEEDEQDDKETSQLATPENETSETENKKEKEEDEEETTSTSQNSYQNYNEY